MKRLLFFTLAAILLFASCKKSKERNPVTVMLNGRQTTLNIESATFGRSGETNSRTLVLTAYSEDGQTSFNIALFLEGTQGNNVEAGTYPVSTSGGGVNVITAHHLKKGSNGEYSPTRHYATAGEMIITKGDGSITGTFNITFTDASTENPLTPVVLKDGRLENLKYHVFN
ncbi:hypothetical protein HHL16_11700 [Pseudoflavitalea sp. G-6-1-2]|uniref:hypothetical protein n=1 Tax=Pseudoflavitalea sp. G-6-1-2 TaxID=2728841 RepID=UPI00146B0BB0|nr:hypothetical protein [Pseudoflavitalea sp. G-6-1-2]NML21543.1 hypothetical protein [Pseudoflavitalea sp. G-6-1-2]